jgi:hypothetical protein
MWMAGIKFALRQAGVSSPPEIEDAEIQNPDTGFWKTVAGAWFYAASDSVFIAE